MSTSRDDALTKLRAEVRALGSKFDGSVLKATRELYRPHVARWPDDVDIRIAKDEVYGADLRQRIDVYTGDKLNAPVVVFVPGGGFVAGDKSGDQDFYANVGRFLARAGYVAVAINYRLAPEYGWPAGALDVQSAVEWTSTNIASFGGDASRIALLGHSAGASHVATYLYDPDSCRHALQSIRGAILFSGVYDTRATPLSAGARSYFGADDPAILKRRSVSEHVGNCPLPVLIGIAEFDTASIAEQAFHFARLLTRRNGKGPAFAWMAGHNHVSTVHSLGSTQPDVGWVIDSFLNELWRPSE